MKLVQIENMPNIQITAQSVFVGCVFSNYQVIGSLSLPRLWSKRKCVLKLCAIVWWLGVYYLLLYPNFQISSANRLSTDANWIIFFPVYFWSWISSYRHREYDELNAKLNNRSANHSANRLNNIKHHIHIRLKLYFIFCSWFTTALRPPVE